jgi:hypothetical protein
MWLGSTSPIVTTLLYLSIQIASSHGEHKAESAQGKWQGVQKRTMQSLRLWLAQRQTPVAVNSECSDHSR